MPLSDCVASSLLPGAVLTVSLTDSDLAGDGSATARVINGNGLDTETVTLIESGTTPGDFSGTIATVFDAGASAVIGAQKDDVIHSRPGDFKLAIDMAVLKSLVAMDTKLLEPMLAFRITAPEEFIGKVTGDVVNMRGTFEPADFERGQFILRGRVPLATSMDHTIRLSSATGGRGSLSARFDGYQNCPPELGVTRAYKGISPLDRAKYILWWRGAITDSIRG